MNKQKKRENKEIRESNQEISQIIIKKLIIVWKDTGSEKISKEIRKFPSIKEH